MFLHVHTYTHMNEHARTQTHIRTLPTRIHTYSLRHRHNLNHTHVRAHTTPMINQPLTHPPTHPPTHLPFLLPTHIHTHRGRECKGHRYTYTHMQLHLLSRGRIIQHLLICSKAHTHVRIHLRTKRHPQTLTYVYMCAWACAYMCTHTHTHTHPHLRTHHVNICMRTRKYYQLNETEAASHNAPTTMCEETKISNHQSPIHTSAPFQGL